MLSMQKKCVKHENVSLYYTIPYAFCGKKKTLRSSQGLDLGLLSAGQMFLQTEPGIGAEDRRYISKDTAQCSGWYRF